MAIRRITVNGRKVWQARLRFHGLRTSTIRATKDDARQAEAELLQTLKTKRATAAEAAAAPATVRALFEAYAQRLADRGKGPDTIAVVAQTARAVERLLPEWLDRPVSALTEADVFAFRRARVERSVVALRYQDDAAALRARAQAAQAANRPRSAEAALAKAARREQMADAAQRAGTKPSTINRDLRTLRAMVKSVRPDFRFPPGVFFPEDDTRVRWLRPEEEVLVLEPIRSPFRAMAKLAASTLMRQGEVRTLRWPMVHFEQGVILLPRAKGGPRSVMLSAAAQDLLREQRAATASRAGVFPSPDDRPYGRSAVSRAFRRAARGAGLQDFRFHDLRHHGATMALNRGFTAPIVMALGGWKSQKMMSRYAAVTDQTLHAAAEAVSGREPWPATTPARAAR